MVENLIYFTIILSGIAIHQKSTSFLKAFKNIQLLYFATTFPEVGKLLIIILRTWDHEALLLILAAILITSMQRVALKSVVLSIYDPTSRTNNLPEKTISSIDLFVILICAIQPILARGLFRSIYIVYSAKIFDIWSLCLL